MVAITSSVLLGYAKSAVVFIATLIVLTGLIGFILRKTRSPVPVPTPTKQAAIGQRTGQQALYPGTGIPVSDAEAAYYATNPYYYSDPYSLWYYYDWMYDPWWYYGSSRRHHHYHNNHHGKPKPPTPTTTQPAPTPPEPELIPTEPVSILPTEPVSILPPEPALIPTIPELTPVQIPEIPLIQDLANQPPIPPMPQIINTSIQNIPQPPPAMNSIQAPPPVTEGFTGGMDSPSSCYLKQAWNSGLYVRGGIFIPAANTYGDKWESANWGPK